MDKRNPAQTREVGEWESKDVLGLDSPTAPHWTPAPTFRQSKGSRYGAPVNERLFPAQHEGT